MNEGFLKHHKIYTEMIQWIQRCEVEEWRTNEIDDRLASSSYSCTFCYPCAPHPLGRRYGWAFDGAIPFDGWLNSMACHCSRIPSNHLSMNYIFTFYYIFLSYFLWMYPAVVQLATEWMVYVVVIELYLSEKYKNYMADNEKL